MKRYNNLYKTIHPDGYVFIITFLLITIIFFTFNNFLGFIGICLSFICIYFFRNPSRVVPIQKGLIVSPADGIIQSIKEVSPIKEFEAEFAKDEKMIRVSIFLNIFNVHVNRIPYNGKILKLNYIPGKFFNASLDKASIHNERQSVLIQNTDFDHKIILVQIAGLIARRIVCDLEEDSYVNTGETFGIIRFGSRVDMYLPKDSNIKVSVGQTTIGGETIICDVASQIAESDLTFIKK
ncbi:MAG: phosphatidylserine decarboxylase [Rickettsia sp.]|nr:phosphatidylserine decarboxylase [Rickettsia sp.]